MSHCITIVSVLVCLAIILLITFYHCFTGWNIFWLQKKGTKLKPPKHKRKFIGSNTKFSTWVRPGFRESNNFLLISVFTLLLAAYIFSHRIRLPPCSQRRWPYATTTYLEYIAMFILEYIGCDGKVSFFFSFLWKDTFERTLVSSSRVPCLSHWGQENGGLYCPCLNHVSTPEAGGYGQSHSVHRKWDTDDSQMNGILAKLPSC